MSDAKRFGLAQASECLARVDYLLDAEPRRYHLINRWWPRFPERPPTSYYHDEPGAYDRSGRLIDQHRYRGGVIELAIDDDQFDFDFCGQGGSICSRRFRETLEIDSSIVEYIPVDDSRCSPEVRAMEYHGLHLLRLNDRSLEGRPALFFMPGDFRMMCNVEMRQAIELRGLSCKFYDPDTRGWRPPKHPLYDLPD
ncbi:hypothetical protein [Sphingopyxis sp. KK2]|uniref:hypothetical protein n=1 Tax=Sphingopyxis sp. KK2 TaxID=1855727 RepID=UPI001181B517|nr:hypothetical protein [Sphingopyxis sp. KK2]